VSPLLLKSFQLVEMLSKTVCFGELQQFHEQVPIVRSNDARITGLNEFMLDVL